MGGRREERHLRALLALGRGADDLERRNRIAEREAHVMLLAVAPDREVEPFAERVDHRNADAVQAARNLVRVLVRRVLELPAGVQLGHDDFGSRNALFAVDARRDAAAIVLDRNRAVRVQLDQNLVAMPRQRLVDRIVRNLEHHVVQARSVVGVADVHARRLRTASSPLSTLIWSAP